MMPRQVDQPHSHKVSENGYKNGWLSSVFIDNMVNAKCQNDMERKKLLKNIQNVLRFDVSIVQVVYNQKDC